MILPNYLLITTEKKIDLLMAKVALRADGILCILFKQGVLIDHQLQREIARSCERMGFGKPLKVLIQSEDFLITEKSFWEKCRRSERFAHGQLVAVVAPTPGLKLLAQNYRIKHKPENPYRIFNSDEDAIHWLNTYSAA